MLQKLIKKKNLVIVGLNAGTSADGLDLAAIRFRKSSKKPVVSFIAGRTVSYPKNLNKQVHDILSIGKTPVDEIIKLDRKLGVFYGEQTDKFCGYLKRRKIHPDMIASHGQTILHIPGRVQIGRKKESGTMQLGHPESIARQTGFITIADFRQADIASGGEGAPITGLAMWYLMGNNRESRLAINIGGIANYFLFPKNKSADSIQAEDCGPGNSLLDIITREYFGKKYDHLGRLASKGEISMRLLSILLSDKYLKGKYGPSTGRERFGEKFAEKIVKVSSKLKLKRHDVLASITELTAITIAAAVQPYLSKYKIKKIYLFGGGVKNTFLQSRLRANIPGVEFFSVDRLGLNPDFLEATCYAVMGGMAISSQPAGLPHVTGASDKMIAGRIIQPLMNRHV
jgi:anhydro-N-acetylmuramic acid kinase